MKFSDIPQLTRSANYSVTMEWRDLEAWLERQKRNNLQIDPPFQRAHVWDEVKQVKFVEYVLRGGKSSRDIQWNCAGWMVNFKGPMYLVDGKQRLNAVLRFLKNEIRAFGYLCNEFEGTLGHRAHFIFHVNDLPTYRDVLNWYLELNDGGIAHTVEELQLVRDMLLLEELNGYRG